MADMPMGLPEEIGAEIPLIERAEATIAELETQFLKLANVVGVGYGLKETDPEKKVFQVFVTRKVPTRRLPVSEIIPEAVAGFEIDVIEVGVIVAQFEPLATRIRPLAGGWSVGHVGITAGTIGIACYDLAPGATVTPPAHGVGIPDRYYILSNNHVLANSNNARIGDPIVQPGPIDGGVHPRDTIGLLRRYVPIDFDPPKARTSHVNLVDAAVAEVEINETSRWVDWLGHIEMWRPRRLALPGQIMKKTGRTTGFTTGRLVSIGATVDVAYGGGRVARFRDQMLMTNMSRGGDSGSLVTSLSNTITGLLFAGSPQVTVVNHIENVRALLRVEVAEGIEPLGAFIEEHEHRLRSAVHKGNGGGWKS